MLLEQAIDIPLDLFVFFVQRLTFCPVDILKCIADLFVEVSLALAQLLNRRVLPQVLQLLRGRAMRSTRIDHAAHPVRSNNQSPSRHGASMSRLRIVPNHAGEIILLKDHRTPSISQSLPRWTSARLTVDGVSRRSPQAIRGQNMHEAGLFS